MHRRGRNRQVSQAFKRRAESGVAWDEGGTKGGGSRCLCSRNRRHRVSRSELGEIAIADCRKGGLTDSLGWSNYARPVITGRSTQRCWIGRPSESNLVSWPGLARENGCPRVANVASPKTARPLPSSQAAALASLNRTLFTFGKVSIIQE